jgi:hypothetical protein
MRTNSGLWEIHNETRYSTEDILAIFNAYEAVLATSGPVKATHTWGGTGVFRFRDYSPASRTTERRVWNGNEYVREENFNFVRQAIWGANTEHVIGLIKPSMLYESPLEALAAVTDGEERAPSGFSLAVLREAVRYGYSADRVLWNAFENAFPAGGAEVRLLPKREGRKSSKPVKGLVVRQLRSKVGEGFSSVARAELSVAALLANCETIKNMYASIDLPCPIETTAIEDVNRSISLLRSQLDAAYQSLDV